MGTRVKLVALPALLLGLVCLLGAPAQVPDNADAALKVATPKARPKAAPPPAAAQVSNKDEPRAILSRERLLKPPEWRPPILRSVLGRARQGAQQPPSPELGSEETPADLNSPIGSYAELRPQQLGEAHQASARLQGFMFTVLRSGYSLSLQHTQNVALVPVAIDDLRGRFALHAESAGHYLIALHLSNPSTTSYVFTNRLQRSKTELPLPPVVTTLVEQRESVGSGASFVVPCLLQLEAGEWADLMWYMGGGDVLFHALTVDKIG